MHQEFAFGRHPLVTIFRKSAAGHHEMDMRVILQWPSPGMKHTKESGHVAAYEPLVGFERAQRGGRLVEHGFVYGCLIGSSHRAQFLRQRECRHKIRAWKQLKLPLVHPFGRFAVLTDRAMPIAAGGVGDMALTTVGTFEDMISPLPLTTFANRINHLLVCLWDPVPKALQICLSMLAEYLLNTVHDNTPRTNWLSFSRERASPSAVT